VREVLVAHPLADVGLGHEHERGSERLARARQQDLVEIGERDDQPDVVLLDYCGERPDVARIVDARDERVAVGVVQRRRERVEVGRDRRRARLAECRDDVDPLPRAGEEDGAQRRPPSGLP
jgi:hypothetical protein